MTKKLLLFAFSVLSIMLKSQSEPRAFEDWKTKDGTQNFFHKNVTKTDGSGNVYVAGATITSNGTTDILLAKKNSSGVTLWTRQYNGTANFHDFATGLHVDGSGNVFVTGAVTNNTVALTQDAITIKYNSSGTQQWVSTYDGGVSGGAPDIGKDIVLNSSGVIFVTGATYNASGNTDFLTICYNSSGTQQWVSTYDYTSNLDDASAKIATKTTTAVTVTGMVTVSPNNYKVGIIQYDATTGSTISVNISTTTITSSISAVSDMVIDASNNTYITGAIPVTGQGYDYCTIKLTSNLVLSWQQTFNGSDNLNDWAKGLQVDASGNVYITGFSESTAGGKNYCTIKYNSSGTQQWVQSYNSSANGEDEANDLVIDASSNVYVTGSTPSDNGDYDYYTIKYNSSGTKLWEVLSDGISMNDVATNIALDSLNNVIVTGESEAGGGLYTYLTIKYAQYDVIHPTDFNNQVNDKTFLYNENIGQEMNESLAPIADKKFVVNSSPKYYFEGNNLSMVFASCHADSNMVDTIHRVDLLFENSNEGAKLHASEAFGVNPTYLLGQLTSPTIASKGKQRLFIPELYDGIDLHYYSNNSGGLKYYFVVKPGADPRDIIQFFNSTSYTTAINGSNQLIVTTPVGKITLDAPLAYQINGGGTPVAITGTTYWNTYATNKYDFTVPTYTNTMALVIMINQLAPQQPLSPISIGNMRWSTFIGGGNDDKNWEIAVDKFGNQHIAGATNSINLPTTGYQLINSSTVYTANRYGVYYKFNSLNEIRICTYMGGDQQTDAFGVATNSQGDAYICGTTQAIDFPTQMENGAYNDTIPGSTFGGTDEDAFIVKYNSLNQFVWGTYFGGGNNDGASAITIDKNDNMYLVGRAKSTISLVPNGSAYQDNFNGNRDVFIAKFNSSDSLIWFTYYGDTNSEEAYSCKTDTNSNLFVTGTTLSSNFPTYRASSSYYKDSTLNGATNDIFILKFNSSGVRQWATLYGGSGYDYSSSNPGHKGIAFDHAQSVYIVDNTTSSDLFTKRLNGTCYYDSIYGGNTDGFLLKFSSGLVLQYATYIGEAEYDFVNAVAFDSNDNLYLTYETQNGSTQTTSFGGYYYQNTMYGNPLSTTFGLDNFLLSLNGSMNRRWASFLGGTSHNAVGDGGTSIAIRGSDFYLTGFCNSYYVNSSDVRFPISYDGIAYIDSTYNDNGQTNTCDGFVSKFDLSAIIGIQELFNDKTSELLLYPNPTKSSLYIKYKSLKQEKVKMSIFSLDGKLVFETNYPTIEGDNLVNINTSNLTSGMYLFRIQGENYSVTEKFVKYE